MQDVKQYGWKIEVYFFILFYFIGQYFVIASCIECTYSRAKSWAGWVSKINNSIVSQPKDDSVILGL